MKQDQYATANQLWNAGTTEGQQLNPGGPTKGRSSGPANLTESPHSEPPLSLRPVLPASN